MKKGLHVIASRKVSAEKFIWWKIRTFEISTLQRGKILFFKMYFSRLTRSVIQYCTYFESSSPKIKTLNSCVERNVLKR